MATGIFLDLTNEQHHSSKAVGSSGLKLLAQSPLHLWSAAFDKNRPAQPPTPAQRMGSIVHTVTLEPHKIDDLFVILPEGIDRRTKEGKAIYAEIIATGKEPILDTEWRNIEAMAAAVHAHPVTRVLIEKCESLTEVSMFWTDDETGIECKIRPDICVPPCSMFPRGLIADLKTTDDATEESFSRTIWNYEMFIQSAFYPVGYMKAFNTKEPPDFLWLAQEKKYPYCNRYYSCPPKLAAFGFKKVRSLLTLMRDCLDKYSTETPWPGYPQNVQPIEMPVWAEKIIEGGV